MSALHAEAAGDLAPRKPGGAPAGLRRDAAHRDQAVPPRRPEGPGDVDRGRPARGRARRQPHRHRSLLLLLAPVGRRARSTPRCRRTPTTWSSPPRWDPAATPPASGPPGRGRRTCAARWSENLRQLGRDHLDVVNYRSNGRRLDRRGGRGPGRAPGGRACCGTSASPTSTSDRLDEARSGAPRSSASRTVTDVGSTLPDAVAVIERCRERGLAFVPFFAIAGEARETGSTPRASDEVLAIAGDTRARTPAQIRDRLDPRPRVRTCWPSPVPVNPRRPRGQRRPRRASGSSEDEVASLSTLGKHWRAPGRRGVTAGRDTRECLGGTGARSRNFARRTPPSRRESRSGWRSRPPTCSGRVRPTEAPGLDVSGLDGVIEVDPAAGPPRCRGCAPTRTWSTPRCRTG